MARLSTIEIKEVDITNGIELPGNGVLRTVDDIEIILNNLISLIIEVEEVNPSTPLHPSRRDFFTYTDSTTTPAINPLSIITVSSSTAVVHPKHDTKLKEIRQLNSCSVKTSDLSQEIHKTYPMEGVTLIDYSPKNSLAVADGEVYFDNDSEDLSASVAFQSYLIPKTGELDFTVGLGLQQTDPLLIVSNFSNKALAIRSSINNPADASTAG